MNHLKRAILTIGAVAIYADLAAGVTVIDTDTVYDGSVPGDRFVVVDGEAPPTVFEFVDPAMLRIVGAPVVELKGVSVLNMSGGQMEADLGSGPVILAGEASTVDVTGGFILGEGGIVARNEAFVRMSGGSVGSLDHLGAMELHDEVQGEITGGMVSGGMTHAIRLTNNARLRITGGTILNELLAEGMSLLDVFGGSFGRGERSQIRTADEAAVNIYGGMFSRPYSFIASEGGVFNIFGHGLVMGPPEPEPLTDFRRLMGTLADGTELEIFVSGNIILHEAVLELQPGDANRDFTFDQADIVRVSQAAKYLTGQPATWGEGDWNGAPGGTLRNPPAGNGLFDQMDIVAAQQSGVYLTGRYVAVRPNGQQSDPQTSLVYDANTGEVSVDAPAGVELTSINIYSAAGIFTGAAAQNLGGSFDNDADTNIFKATFGSSFGSLSLGKVAEAGLAKEFLLSDLTVVGSLEGGGGLGEVDLVYVPVPEPASVVLLVMAFAAMGLGYSHVRCRRKY